MQSWLYNIEKKILVSICIKDLKLDLEAASHRQRAEVLALAQHLRCEVLEQIGIDQDVLDNPLEFNRARLIQQFEMMERIWDQARHHLRIAIKNLHHDGRRLPGISLQHVQNTLCALELWMCTLGAGFVADKRHEVGHIWQILEASQGSLEQAISSMRQVEVHTVNLTGIPRAGMFHRIDTDEWLKRCNFIPSAFAHRPINQSINSNSEKFHA